MRKGALEKKQGYYSIYNKHGTYKGNMRGWIWDRFSSGKGGCINIHAYLNAHDLKTYSVSATNDRQNALRHGFDTIEEAFAWGESHVDYEHNKICDPRFDFSRQIGNYCGSCAERFSCWTERQNALS